MTMKALALTILGGLAVGLVGGLTNASEGAWTAMFVGYIALVVVGLTLATRPGHVHH